MVKLLSSAQDTMIRNTLDHIGSNLYHGVVVYEDMCWAHKTIRNLLFTIDELQQELNMRDSGG